MEAELCWSADKIDTKNTDIFGRRAGRILKQIVLHVGENNCLPFSDF